MHVYDVVGVGFGPANLAVAIAARELAADLSTVFVERQPTFEWHGGMLLDGATMQSSFLKDLVTLRNPQSAFTFLSYVKAMRRLEYFANMSTLYPSRLEFNDYFCWAASQFTDSVLYSTEVQSIEAEPTVGFRVTTTDLVNGSRRELLARNVVVGVGGSPRVPLGMRLSDRVIHSSGFLSALSRLPPPHGSRYVFGVVGAGQSAGEIASHLLSTYADADVHLIMRTAGPQRLDDNPFVNDHFSTEWSERFYRQGDRRRGSELTRLKTANYGVMSDDLLERLYASEYEGRVRRVPRFVIHRECDVLGADEVDGQVVVHLSDCDGLESALRYDSVFLATGYDRSFSGLSFLQGLDGTIERDDDGSVRISPAHRLRLRVPTPGGVYVLGYHQSHFGYGDALLSHIALRAGSIMRDVCSHETRAEDASVGAEEGRGALSREPR